MSYAATMTPRLFVEVEPRELHLPAARMSGADGYKLQRQIAKYGASVEGMPVPEVYRGRDGRFVIYNGVTRVAKLRPGMRITVEVVDELAQSVGHLPTVGSRLS